MTGQAVGSKPINLSQLQTELATAGVPVSSGLGMHDESVYTYDQDGVAADFPVGQQAVVDQAIAAHTAMRDKTDAEYAAEFQSASAARKQDIRDQQSGLMPREQVPM